jgi:hypothetical protein
MANDKVRLYCYRRHVGERTTILAGLDRWAESPEDAMIYLRATMGRKYTATQGWYAEDVTDNTEYRQWANT